MRLSTPVSPCLAAAAALVLSSSLAVGAVAGPAAARAGCTATGTGDFPLSTRIVGGPASYEAGGKYGSWRIEVRNTTGRTCTGIHPVVVLVDGRHALKPGQARLEFSHGGREHTVRFEETDEDELVGAFADGDGFDGFSVGPRGTLAVDVRLAFGADAVPDAVPNDVTANAAVVQRHEDDGDWVGQSNDYRFTVREASDEDEPPAEDESPSPHESGTAAGTGGTPTPTPTPRPDGTAASPGPAEPTDPGAAPDLHGPGQLAATGPLAHRTALAAAGLLLAGATLTLVRRPFRRRR
ncbi:hypothetical protein [Streptomyces griseosporeus]|uniref:hypothetical protein n=1 Tax=Streptomyces griseosporeus TaxID=1910 RepID=UPI00199BA954|nr:hypothetical protein [Streptomyces griseosporeus]GHF67036.1 hypothetical protein GCM10018783_40400 [Streptomyces griseosporeus]